MNAIAADTNNRNNIRLTLSPNLNLFFFNFLDQPLSNEPQIRLVKEDYKQVGVHGLPERTVIQLTFHEYSLLKASFNSANKISNILLKELIMKPSNAPLRLTP